MRSASGDPFEARSSRRLDDGGVDLDGRAPPCASHLVHALPPALNSSARAVGPRGCVLDALGASCSRARPPRPRLALLLAAAGGSRSSARTSRRRRRRHLDGHRRRLPLARTRRRCPSRCGADVTTFWKPEIYPNLCSNRHRLLDGGADPAVHIFNKLAPPTRPSRTVLTTSPSSPLNSPRRELVDEDRLLVLARAESCGAADAMYTLAVQPPRCGRPQRLRRSTSPESHSPHEQLAAGAAAVGSFAISCADVSTTAAHPPTIFTSTHDERAPRAPPR